MLKAGVQDAENGHVDVQIPIDELWKLLERDRTIFEEVVELKKSWRIVIKENRYIWPRMEEAVKDGESWLDLDELKSLVGE